MKTVDIQCSSCGTRYRVRASDVAQPNAVLRCTRCHHVFPAPATENNSPRPRRRSRRAKSQGEGTLRLPFGRLSRGSSSTAPPADELDEVEREEEFVLGIEDDDAIDAGGGENRGDDHDLPLFLDDSEARAESSSDELDSEEEGSELFGAVEEDEEELAPETAAVTDDALDEVTEPEPAPKPTPVAPKRRRSTPRAPAVTGGNTLPKPATLMVVAVPLFLLFYALVGQLILNDSEKPGGWLQRAPIIGSNRSNRVLATQVGLSDLKGSFHRMQDGKRVFVIAGLAQSHALAALQDIEISAELRDSSGQVLRQKSVYCGSVISARLLSALSRGELSLLQKMDPPQEFKVAPGGETRFSVVFVDPPEAASGFQVRVKSARRHV